MVIGKKLPGRERRSFSFAVVMLSGRHVHVYTCR